MNRSLHPLLLALGIAALAWPVSVLAQSSPQTGSVTRTTDVVDALGNPALHRANLFVNVFTHRRPNGDDNIFASTISTYVEHGWVNSNEQQMNVASQQNLLFLNTDAQVGGATETILRHYGQGDGVGLAMDLFCTGVNRGSDEGCEPFRVEIAPHSDNAGFRIESVTVDSMGQTILIGPRDPSNGYPIALPGHNPQAASENALLINLNPAKTYTTGSVQSISTCPAGEIGQGGTGLFGGTRAYVCLVGDGDAAGHAGAQWDERFRASTVTRLTAAIPLNNFGGLGKPICQGPGTGDQFSAGPVPCDIPVASLAGFTKGGLIAISSAEDDFEMPVVLGINPDPFPAVLYGAPVQDERQQLTRLNAITRGGFTITVDGQVRQVTGVDLSYAISLSGVAAAIRVPGARVTYDSRSHRFSIASNNTGERSQVSFAVPSSGAEAGDLGSALGLTAANNPVQVQGGAGTLHVFLSKPHIAESLVTTGGGVGYAINFKADTIAPNQWVPTDEGGPGADYRMAWPIIATLPGNILVTEHFPYNQGTALGTRAFGGTRITTAPAFQPIIRDGKWVDSQIDSPGNAEMVVPKGTFPSGGIRQAPLPRFTIAGCATAPVGHFGAANGIGGYVPVIDSPGAGCPEHPRVTIDATYNNPYEIHPAAWIRSVYDAGFAARYPDHPYGPFHQADYNQAITPSTVNYYALDGTLPCSASTGFCRGDGVEQVYNMHQTQVSRINFYRPVYDVGITGGIMNFNFMGHAGGDSLVMIANQDPAANFFGTPAAHFYPDAQRHGGVDPPTGQYLSGPLATAIRMDQLPARSVAGGGVVLDVECSTNDATAPCRNGAWWPYRLWHGDAPAGSMDLQVNPQTGVLAYRPSGPFHAENGSFPGMQTALVGRTQAQVLLLGGKEAGANAGGLYLLNSTDSTADADQGKAGCVLFDDGVVKFNCGARTLVHDAAGWQFDAATAVRFEHTIVVAAPPPGDDSSSVPTTAWVNQALAGARPGAGAASVSGVLGSASGSGAKALRFAGAADSFQVSFTTGATTQGGAPAVAVAFAPAFPGVRTCLINGGNDAAMAVPVYARSVTAAGFSLYVPASTRVPGGTELVYSVQCR
jgi:hypothetical protein